MSSPFTYPSLLRKHELQISGVQWEPPPRAGPPETDFVGHGLAVVHHTGAVRIGVVFARVAPKHVVVLHQPEQVAALMDGGSDADRFLLSLPSPLSVRNQYLPRVIFNSFVNVII